MFGEKWTSKELAKIAEIKLRPPSVRDRRARPLKQNPRMLAMMKEIEGMSNAQVSIYMKKNCRYLGG